MSSGEQCKGISTLLEHHPNFNYPIGSLTEYFKFDRQEMALAVKSGLERMEPKVLSQLEQRIVENEVSPIAIRFS